MATLIISHNIYLNREQRYALHERTPQDAVGISIPVWFHKGNTSEPAKEIFCKYQITNDSSIKAVVPTNDGYIINIPQHIKFKSNSISEEVRDFLNQNISTSEKLLDLKDGGSEWLDFRSFGKISHNEIIYNVIHFIEIKPMESLLSTLD